MSKRTHKQKKVLDKKPKDVNELIQFKVVADQLKGKKYVPPSGGPKVTKGAYNKMAAEIAKKLELATRVKVKRNKQKKPKKKVKK